jgi:homocitrate synthase NifV
MIRKNMEPVFIIDSTLRDGEQAPGVAFRREQKIRIARMLADVGVDEIEVGIPAMGEEERETIREIRRLGLPPRLTCWCRATAGDIQLAGKCGTGGVHISLPVSPIHLHALGKSAGRVLDLMREMLDRARNYFDRVSVGAQDALRADPDYLEAFVAHAADCGADRVRIADTVGIASPGAIHRLFQRLVPAAGKMALEFHGHDDLGMATANAITAVEAGASALSVTVNGLGERAGNAPLEEVAAALAFAAAGVTNLRTSSLPPLCDYVAQASGRPIPPDKPITGSAAFQHESGIHCAGMLKDPLAYQPFPSEAVGRRDAGFVIGKHSGTHIIQHRLRERGIEVDRNQARRLLEKVRDAATAKGTALSSAELVEIYCREADAGPACAQLAENASN